MVQRAQHINQAFDRHLNNLRTDFGLLLEMAEQSLAGCLRALATMNTEQALQVRNADRKINALYLEVASASATIIALHQPVARDLRLLVSRILMAGHLERLADHAKNIAKRIVRMKREGLTPVFHQELITLGGMSHKLFVDYIAASAADDLDAAIRVWHADDAIDEAYHLIMDRAYRGEHKGDIGSLVHSSFIAKNIERTGDMVKNLVEQFHYQVGGEMSAGFPSDDEEED